MPEFIVLDKQTGAEKYRYAADAPVEWNEFPFTSFDHVEVVVQNSPLPEAIAPEEWRIYVGSFFDRFGLLKPFILGSDDGIVRAMIFDCLPRKYIDLVERRDEIGAMLDIIISKGYQINKAAILDAKPSESERAKA